MCHSSKQRLLVKEIRNHLPHLIGTWIDEKEIAVGENITSSITKAIREECDFFIVVIDENAIKSSWVLEEINMALTREKELNRTFFLPIVIDKDSWDTIDNREIKLKKYLNCPDHTDASIESVSKQLVSELLTLLSREFEVKKRKIENFPLHSRDNLVSPWDSTWYEGPKKRGEKSHEYLEIYRQEGYEIFATATRKKEPDKKWEIRGRWDGFFLQMYWFPSSDSKKRFDSLDYGCYFFERKGDGSFVGFSTGYGKRKKPKIATDYHELKRIINKKINLLL
jgi:hypothetical protein